MDLEQTARVHNVYRFNSAQVLILWWAILNTCNNSNLVTTFTQNKEE